MDALSITHRLLSTSSTSSVKTLLLAFGVTNPNKVTLPVVFNSKYDAEWRTFIEEADFAAPDAESRLLYTILEFIRYMRYNKKNPFARKVADPATKAPLNPEKIYKRLIDEQLAGLVTEADKVVKKHNFLSVMTRKKLSVFVNDLAKHYQIVSYSTLSPRLKSRETLDSVLLKLSGFSGKLPVQLQDKTVKGKSTLSKPTELEQKTPLDWGWLVLTKSNKTTVAIKRAKDTVVLRIIANLDKTISLGSGDTATKHIIKSWKALKTAEKL